MHHHRVFFAFAVAAAIAFTGPASADVVYNDIDDTVDVVVETMSLQYDDTNNIAGPKMQTILKIDVDGVLGTDDSGADHPNCNIQGGAHYLAIAADQTHERGPDSASPTGCVSTRAATPCALWSPPPQSARRR